jgi:solute carrier family 25 phosphate transporter 3
MIHRLSALAREAGFRGLFAGLGPRMVMTAGLVSSQFLMYGGLKTGKDLPVSCVIKAKISSQLWVHHLV